MHHLNLQILATFWHFKHPHQLDFSQKSQTSKKSRPELEGMCKFKLIYIKMLWWLFEGTQLNNNDDHLKKQQQQQQKTKAC